MSAPPDAAAAIPPGARAAADAKRGARVFPCALAPVEVLGRLADQRHPFLLDSAGSDRPAGGLHPGGLHPGGPSRSGDRPHPDGRFSVLGCNPWALLRAKDGRAWLELYPDEDHANKAVRELGDPLAALSALEAALRVDAPPPAPLAFAGGAVGYLGYDLGRDIERIPRNTVDDLGTDDLCLAWHDWALVFDHAEQRWWLAATARHPGQRALETLLDEREVWLAQRLARRLARDPEAGVDSSGLVPLTPAHVASPAEAEPSPAAVSARRGFSPQAYVVAVGQAIEHIRAGDIYQVNLSQRFDVPLAAGTSPLTLYGRLRARTRALFSAYLDTPSASVLSLSPERFLRVRGRAVETCPIKGTRPRGADPQQDAALAAALTASAKDRAELSMIVDLERNDLGRVCEPGTVQVAEHAALYTLATVHHTVTRVAGTLRSDVDTAALLRATFPGGSITGAPKIRAMEIIEALEPTRRGVYTGAVGYLDYGGDLDLNIAIRTVPVIGDTAYVQAGGGIVAESDPDAEHEETLTKAAALLEGLGARVP